MELKNLIRDIPDFPKQGIIFKDITPLLKDHKAFNRVLNLLKEHYENMEFDYIAGVEARGFIVAAPLSCLSEKGFIPIRKPGKLPAAKISASYELEYGENKLEIHCDAINEGDKILLIDDLLATGGTVQASIELIENLGGKVVSIGFLLELEELNGRDKFKGYDVFSLLKV